MAWDTIQTEKRPEDSGRFAAAKAKIAVFAVLAVVWVVLDQLCKSVFAGQTPGGILAGPFAGIFDIRLVHNTGGAWGIFSDSTVLLGVLSVVVCVVIVAYFVYAARDLCMVEVIGLALIFAGGIGNAIDRFVQGFVTDFIEFSFFDFPVFNIADIGVTCGFVILFIGIFINWRAEKDA